MRFDLSRSWAPAYIASLPAHERHLVEEARDDIASYPHTSFRSLASPRLDLALALLIQSPPSALYGIHSRLTELFAMQDFPASGKDYARRVVQLLVELINAHPHDVWRFSRAHCALHPPFHYFDAEELVTLFDTIHKSQRTHLLLDFLSYTHHPYLITDEGRSDRVPSPFILHLIEHGSGKKLQECLLRLAPQLTSEHVPALLELLIKGRKFTRQTCSLILANRMPLSKEHLTPLSAALEREKDEQIRATLTQVLPSPPSKPKASSTETTSAEHSPAEAIAHAQTLLAAQRGKKLPRYIDEGTLPSLTWLDATPLCAKEQSAFHARLAAEAPDHQDELARQIASLLQPEDAGALSRALWRGFLAGGEKSSHKWLVYQLGVIGDARVWDELCPALDERSAGHGYHQVEWVLEALARRQTIEASSWLWYVARSAKRHRAEAPARAHLRALAQRDGLSPEDYVKTLHQEIAQQAEDDAWKQWLDTFPSSLPIAEGTEGHADLIIVEDFQLVLRLPSGKIQKSVPSKAPPETKTRFKELKKSLTARKHEVIDYIERMMIAGRSWTEPQFLELFTRHPFMTQVAASLVFIEPDSQISCRYSEGAFIDVEWEAIAPFAQSPHARLTLLHPCHVPPHTLEQWADHLAEGEVLSIVQQIDRPHHPQHERPQSANLQVNTLLGRLERQGWILDGAGYDDAATSSRRRFPDLGIDLFVEHPPIYAVGSWQDETVGEVKLTRLQTSLGKPLKFEQLTALAHAEICLAMARLIG